MNERLRQLDAEIRALSAEMNALVGKSDAGDAELTRGEEIVEAIKAKRGEMERIKALTGEKLAEIAATQEWLNTPAPAPAPSAGKTTIEWDEKEVYVGQTGEGLLSDKKIKYLNSDEYKRAYVKYLRVGGDERRMSGTEAKALNEGFDDQGGFFVPPDWTNEIIDRKPTPMSIAASVQRWTTTSDRKIFPKNAYSGTTDDPNAILYSTGVRVTYPGELPASQTTIDASTPTIGQLEINIHTAMLALDMTFNQLEDSPQSIQAWITNKFAETAMLEYENRIINGTGQGQAEGIILAPNSSATANQPQFLTSGNASALTADGIKKLAHGVAPQYLRNAKWLMNWQNTAQAVDLLKDANGRYLWTEGIARDGLSVSILDRPLLGFPVIYSEFMPNVAANAFPIIFGDLSGFYLVERIGFSIQVLRETKYKQNQVELVGRLRFGGVVAEPWKLKIEKVAP